MVIFEWKGFDKKGAKASGVMDADSAREARAKLKRGGFMVTETNETGPNANRAKRKARKAEKAETKLQAKLRKTLDSARGKGSSQRISKSNLEDVSTFTRQLATLLKAGIPLTEALRAIIEQTTKKRFNMVVRDIRERISQGEPTADALGNHSEFFDDLYVSMVRSGEAAGRLDEVLERLAGFMQGQARVRNKVAAAMAYPIIMLCIGVLVVAALLVLVVPKITTMLEARGEILPLPTRILQNTSDYLVAWWWAFLLLFIFFGLIFNLIYNSEKGRLGIDSKLLKLPLFGDLMTKQALSRFAQTFATLLRSGVPVVRCLEVTETVLGNRLLEHTIQDVRAKILEGADIAGPIKTSGVFPPLMGYMIAVGEQSGELDTMMLQVGEAYEEEVEISTQKFTSLVEPILIVFLAVLVGFIVLSILWPVLQLSQSF
ncbi:MAG: type II secretion system F family protein [Planctomycetota bacterium]|jgi:general secretion pathway protein F|nr:type II secretion system F family protein [Planctomycetota bacterium]